METFHFWFLFDEKLTFLISFLMKKLHFWFHFYGNLTFLISFWCNFYIFISFWWKTYISTRSTLMPQAVVASSRTIWENIDLKNILKHILKGIFWRELSFSWEIDFLLSRPPRRFNIQTPLNLFFLSWYHVLRLSQLKER